MRSLLLFLVVGVAFGRVVPRLSLLPLHYDIELSPFLNYSTSLDFQLLSKTVILARVVNSTDRFRLLSGATFDSRDVSVAQNGILVGLKSLRCNSERGACEFVLAHNLSITENVTVTIAGASENITTSSELADIFQYEAYEDNSTSTMYNAFSLNTNRLMFPYFSRSLVSATFKLTVNHMSEMKVTTGTPLLRSSKMNPTEVFKESVSGEWVTDEFEVTPKMSAEMVGVSLMMLSSWTIQDRNRSFCVRARQQVMNHVFQKLNLTLTMLHEVEDRLLIRLPGSRYEIIANPQSMAFQSTYRSGRINERYLAANGTEAILTMMLFSQWAGCQRVPTSDRDVWINIALVTQLLIWGQEWTTQNASTDEESMFLQAQWFRESGLGNAPPFSRPGDVTKLTMKGPPATLRQLRYWLGEKALVEAVGDFLRDSRIINFDFDDFSLALQRRGASKMHLASFKRFADLVGLPVVTCSVDGNQLLLMQRRFLLNSTTPKFSNPENSTWILPITMVTSNNVTSWRGTEVKELLQWMTQETQAFASFNEASRPSWYLLNLLSAGNYRVNYDTRNWHALVEQFNRNHSVFSFQDRIRVIDDSFWLASAGYIDFAVPMNLARYFQAEKSKLVRLIAWLNMMRVKSWLASNDTHQLYSNFLCKQQSSINQLVDELKSKDSASFDQTYFATRMQTALNSTCQGTSLYVEGGKLEKLGEDAANSLHKWLIKNEVDTDGTQ